MDHFMELAIAEARKDLKDGAEEPFGAIIVKDGKVLGKGHDEVKETSDPTSHAEIMAIREACKKIGSFDLSGASLYSTCYPCPMCLGAILVSRISKVYYGVDAMDARALGFKSEKVGEEKDKIPSSEIKELGHEECLKLYDEYLSKEGHQK